ncbi:hypothetical protein [Serpentinimonas maccroryi]|uniref:hypothetical protein n=1 Tax=Serpentinimonas maccroryi TaxID=1458426 RepID=UPI0020341E44|nr:hypothetical protein [Serpentinimonas maccroryi]MCM2478849.1 hypothetical protein [Serpentinimonas maccroryi]
MFTTLHRVCKHLLHAAAAEPAQAAAAATAKVQVGWRLINPELGLAAWVAQTVPDAASPRQGAAPLGSAILVLIDPEDCDAPREWARQLAADHPGRPVVLPLWQQERLRRAGVPAEVALQLLLQHLRDDGLVGAAPPMLLSADKTRALARCYVQRYHGSVQTLAGFSDAPALRAGAPALQRLLA